MKHSATFSDLATGPQARAVRPLPEPALTYFPDVRSAPSDRDLTAGAAPTSPSAAMVDDEPHIPVLLDRCVELLAPALTRTSTDGSGATLVDATLGAGGHSERFLTQFPALRLIGLDRDPDALQIAGDRLARFGDRVTLVRTRYDGIAAAVAESNCAATGVDAILFDLGVSSMQLDRVERGFAYSVDAPLDMRMDSGSDLTAAQVLNTYDEKALARVLRVYGEEKFAGRIAAQIVRRRANTPFSTTGELVELLYQAIPAPARRTGGHPAKRTFQALRIEVNAELESLRLAIPAALEVLRPHGRIAVMAYQSLEDRIVKTEFAAATASRTPPGLPVELPGHGPRFVALTRGAERADAEEIERNPRSAPVRLRALEKVGGQ
ncbi:MULTISPECIES: 16S rRNA (cytosine(1402)-N(4))-methyltransferase RsmH [Mycolicibacterium]|uniref:Ribosomal RNA small subunit methyltransferase H n=1 Tax=Mycolicibacterium austroafricanum TaxID=39687 RepID=A0ABT8HGE7_MYCAO|nr:MULTISPECIES: 16S rRNA (cytosine(1402)-N(4))-methyltransferase RsmH [Mycolicibacterium]MDN4519834.1 16S rRNA (cytosine(1402)-N(4))-methyltransferase RsmH [Mycolicibacterium austroafricanum]MDW5614391.1 16S rRNA (cytosine(1402)-N(4))-methyltransferase RsmH [Mycolicibacterium sp. D5.8-2]QRZ04825.1 16S rRNA (cytosine(1402)-N(4))-methyltransferase RsmH [Mycolicibacterium austroafricanum]QZT54855.1 16S rRNA (cytosine(1402)-N(4))-methyltransferase RsmH [Mycolicibacterium austroafricanum]QZT66507.